MAIKKQNRPIKSSVVRPGMKKPGSGKKELFPKKIGATSKKEVLPGKLTGNDAIKKFQKQISPKGMAKAEASAKKAIEKKYPGLFVPETKISSPRFKGK